jgi:hypothetical protein
MTAAGVAAARMTTTLESGAVFRARVVACGAYVALSIPCLVRVEVGECLLPVCGHWPVVTVMRIVTVIDVTVEAAGTMEPGASTDEDPADEPIRPVVAIGSTAIRGIVEVSVGTHRGYPNVDRDLSRCRGQTHQRNSQSRESK